METTTKQGMKLLLKPENITRFAALCGQGDEYLHIIEEHLGLKIHHRGGAMHLQGQDTALDTACQVLRKLYQQTANGKTIDAHAVHMSLRSDISYDDDKNNSIRLKRKHVQVHRPNQRNYVKAIQSHDINFGIGSAGVGKTYLAVACAIHALENNMVDRIILTRPAVEAGERLGFLPGDLAQKIDPYLFPLYDALEDLLGAEQYTRLLAQQNLIELVPLAYMRGRTLTNAFVILDEAQNTTAMQMKMFLTRLGIGSKAVINGDLSQTDLDKKSVSGLEKAIKQLKGIKGISWSYFDQSDIMRHHLIGDIINAWDDRDNIESQ